MLLNKEATRSGILSAYFALRSSTDPDSRVLVFFAGHGSTETGANREVRFLIPYDGQPNDLSTLIRWEDFTLNAELIPAKHILFVMDACYGGMVFNRGVAAGSVRFLKDMLRRPVRQALTAGKQDEPVADGGGPRRDHSIFTGYLLNGLEGAAKAPEGHLTASGLMSYVYKQVSNDLQSVQTPHYGFLSGDGDFVFDAPALKGLASDGTADKDTLIAIPSLEIPEEHPEPTDTFGMAKQFLSDPRMTIQLHDLVVHHVRKVVIETAKERFPVRGVDFTVEEFTRRLQVCEATTQDLRRLLSCLAYWGTNAHQGTLSKAVSRVTDHLEFEDGLVIWNSLRWYPAILLCYCSGISALANSKWDNLNAIFRAPVTHCHGSQPGDLGLAIGAEMLELTRADAFKMLPGHERYHAPRSEYLFKLLQPELDDDLFLGKEYEASFDRFEVLLALVNATVRRRDEKHVWGPVGRFGWKFHRHTTRDNPLAALCMEAKAQGTAWAPFKSGIFGSDWDSFIQAADEYAKMIAGMNWW